MESHFTIHVSAHNDHAVLQRILLAFSRRRLRVRALQFFDLDPSKPANMQFELDCRVEQIGELLAQLRAIIEVTHVCSEQAPVTEATPAAAALAAA